MEASLEQPVSLMSEREGQREKQEVSWEQALVTFRTIVQSSKMKELLLELGSGKWETEFERFGKWFEEIVVRGDILDEDIRKAFSTEDEILENKEEVIWAIGKKFSQAGGWDKNALQDSRIQEILRVVDEAYKASYEMLERKAA